jgi:hypothetical protein
MKKDIALMIIGAQKAGTTSLNTYLSQHPRIYTHYTLEFGLFSNINDYNKGFKYWYNIAVKDKRKFSDQNLFFAKTVGLMYKKDLLLKLKELNPDVKIIVILRNPIERAYSAFWYCKKNGIEPYNDFNDAIFTNDPGRFANERYKPDCDYIGRSSYLPYLKEVYNIFSSKNIKLFLFEEMITGLNKYLNEIALFAGVENFEFNTSIKYNEGRQPKSKLLAKLLAPRKSSSLKHLIPAFYRTKLKQHLKKTNSKNGLPVEKKIMDENTRGYLKNIFSDDMNEIENLTKLPIKKYWQEFYINEQQVQVF